MKKYRYSIFTVLFLLICALPLLAMFVLGPSEAAANEVLASKPSLSARNVLNLNYFSDLGDYLGGRFAFRQELVTANAALTAALFHESASDSVILGTDGWLYYADTLDDYEGASAMTDRDLFRAARTLSLVREYAESQGARFLFTVPPNKNTLYPEHMPGKYPAAQQPGNLDRLVPLLEAQGVPYCDLRAALESAPAPVYYKTDSHWDGYGSALACDAIIESLGGQSALASEDFTWEPHLGDLYEMLCPAGTKTEQGRVLARDRTFTYSTPFHSPEDMSIQTESTGEMGRLLMFRDSFGNLLHADLSEYFSAATFSRSAAARLDLLDGEDVVIWELVERNLPRLLTSAPVMPAPARELDPPAEAAPVSVEYRKTPSAELPGLFCYTGTISGDPDADSPIYISLDGAVYEASPAAPVGQDFTLYTPDASDVQVYLRCGGVWKRAGAS